MGILVHALLWVMQDLYHQPYWALNPANLKPLPETTLKGLVSFLYHEPQPLNPKPQPRAVGTLPELRFRTSSSWRYLETLSTRHPSG